MNLIRTSFFLLVITLTNSVCFAYEKVTHKFLSLSAVEQSVLAAQNSNILTDFGLSTDISEFSQQKFPNSAGESESIVELIRDGAEFEDNFPRSIQHFYDPINDKGLQHPAVSAFTNKSPDWALEDTGQISGQNYSYADAMNAFYDALTLPTKTERDAKWGQVFETLGHVIHHIQDMGQPEHVRNDLHCDVAVPCGFPGALIGLYDKSLFESRSRAVFSAGIPTALTGYPAVTFPTAREFWTTRATDAIPARRGIADFTNRNFVSKDRNFEIKAGIASASGLYDLPVPSGSNVQTLASLLPNNNQGANICQQLNQVGPIDLPPNAPCEIGFIENVVTDSYSPSSTTNQRAASLSLFDQYLTKYNVNGVLVEDGDAFHQMDVDRLPTINRFNIDAAHTYLIPRAVAYSAGTIDHFFKTKIDASGNSGTLTVTNPNSFSINGNFELLSEDASGNRQLVASWVKLLAAGQNFIGQYDANTAVNGTTGYVVFKGVSSQDLYASTVGAKEVRLGFYSSIPQVTWPTWAPVEWILAGSQKTWGSSKKVTRTYYSQHGKIILEERIREIQLAQDAQGGSAGTKSEVVAYSLISGNPVVEWLSISQPIGLQGSTVSFTDSLLLAGTSSYCSIGDPYMPLWSPGPGWLGGVNGYFPVFYTPPTIYIGLNVPAFPCPLSSQQTDKVLYLIP